MLPRRLQPIGWAWQGWKVLEKPDIRLFGYLLVQLLILLVPSIWFALKHRFPYDFGITTLEQVVFTVLGVSGFAVIVLPYALLALLVGDTIGQLLGLLAYVALAILVFLHYYAPTWKRFFLVSMINGYLTAWSLIFGLFFLFLSRQ